ncbi:excisionase [Colwellia sp. PAMC 20917]|jgi:hypothetical protein|nr:excisionase [Colwellia sp. PAMC 20917]
MLNILPLHQYCEISGESQTAVIKRIERGIWIVGQHVIKIPNVRERWIDIIEVEKWARKNKKTRV